MQKSRLAKPASSKESGEGGIRTLDRGLRPYSGLANRRPQPLGDFSIRNVEQYTGPRSGYQGLAQNGVNFHSRICWPVNVVVVTAWRDFFVCRAFIYVSRITAFSLIARSKNAKT